MLTPAFHARRRERLARLVQGPVLLMGNGERARNLPSNPLPFRQDSTFLYFVGHAAPGAAALLHDGRCALFLPRPADDDALWHGAVRSPEQTREDLGIEAVRWLDELPGALKGLRPQTIAVADEETNRRTSELVGQGLRFGEQMGDDALIDAVIALRRAKEPEEHEAMRDAARHTEAAHRAAMQGTRPGGHEMRLAALFEGVLAARGLTPGYATILTQHGEVLHNHAHDAALSAGRLLLLDGGGEAASGYGCDVTRTWPVDGQYTPRQRAAYEAVLEAQLTAIDKVRKGVPYREVHFAAARVIARFLADERLIRVSPDDSIETGAHAVFFPHGVGHLLGLDVHDLRNFGDRPAYPKGQGRSPQFGTSYLRLDLPLEPGWVVTVEPGFYVVPAILSDAKLRTHLGEVVDFDRASAWIGFGGIRIEDDICCTQGDPEVLTGTIPKSVSAIESIVGIGPTPEDRLC